MKSKGFAPILIILFVVLLAAIGIGVFTSSTSNNVTKQLATIQPTASGQTTQPATASQTIQPTSIPAVQSQLDRYVAPPISKTSSCKENNGLPDSFCSPGATDSRVTQSDIKLTICVSGYTTTVRPSTSYTNSLKIKQIQEYGYSDTNLSDYEEDHLIPLEVGGSPTDPANLWPEPYNITYNARQKDKVENYLHDLVCSGAMTLSEAQKEIAQNWESVFNSHYSSLTPSTTTTTQSTQTAAPVATTSTTSSGATGKCVDGTYTNAVNHQGACSHHQGVVVWYQ